MRMQPSAWLTRLVGTMLLAVIWLVIIPALDAPAGQALVSTITLHSDFVSTHQAETANLARTADITFTPAYTAYLPIVSNFRPLQPAGIYGRVTYQGTPIDGQEIQLWLCNTTVPGWSCEMTLYTITQSGGYYQFTTAASLGSNQKYVVYFFNTANDSRFLAVWRSFYLSTYTAGQVLPGGNFDIADMVLLSPLDTADVGFPVTFQWQLRLGAPSDVYMLELYKRNDLSIDFSTTKLGYTGSYTLNNLPTGFTTGVQYEWYVWLFGPSDSIGFTNQYHKIIFH